MYKTDSSTKDFMVVNLLVIVFPFIENANFHAFALSATSATNNKMFKNRYIHYFSGLKTIIAVLKISNYFIDSDFTEKVI
jgi:hypothetical protein